MFVHEKSSIQIYNKVRVKRFIDNVENTSVTNVKNVVLSPYGHIVARETLLNKISTSSTNAGNHLIHISIIFHFFPIPNIIYLLLNAFVDTNKKMKICLC